MSDDLKKAITNSGKVHWVTTGQWKNGNVDPLCNYMSWRGDYWGQPWRVLEDQKTEVTCKTCLKMMEKMMEAELLKNNTDIEKSLIKLGNLMRKTDIDQLTEFLTTSVLCPFRKVTRYRWDTNNKKYHAFKCTDPKLSDIHFGWSCSPSNCPHIGHLPGAFWEADIEKKPNKVEVKTYEDKKQAKFDAKQQKIREGHAMSSSGIVHKLIAGPLVQLTDPCYLTLACDEQNYCFDHSGMWADWKPTLDRITCKHCLKKYWPDGRKK